MTASGRPLPGGTVTFLFTDIEGSTRLLQGLGPAYEDVLEAQRRLVRASVGAEGGREVGTEGDAFFVVFASAARAASAALAAQRALATYPWPEGAAVRVRMGLHTGEATPVDGDYVGLDVHRAARVCAAAWGGQILLSQATTTLIEQALPQGARLRDLDEHRLKDLQRPEHLYQLTAPDLPSDFPPPHTLDAMPNNLPTQLTSFIGREHEVAEARRLLDHTRLLTLTGPGGTGKTRLALQIAAEAADGFADGVFFVPLAPIVDPSLVPSTVAMTFGLHESSGRSPQDVVAEYLRDRRLLLILDNFEQVLAAAPVVSDLLQRSPNLRTMVTSRAALRVSGEQEFPVPPLRLPDPKSLPSLESLSQYEAVALFIQRAVTVKPDFRITNANASAVAEITARLDGLPLAIELAAARVNVLPPEAMLPRLQRRLTILRGGARDLPARQQTLRDTIGWSYDLLGPGIRRLFARLAVFVGGWTLEAAESVCGPASEIDRDVLDGLADLVDHSLIRRDESVAEPRFVMLETIREFALERLEPSGEEDEIRRRHTAVHLQLAELASPHLTGADQAAWLDRLEREHDNLRAALNWAIERDDADTALRMGGALWRFWQMRGHLQEARERLGRILALPGAGAHPQAHAGALEALGGIAYWQGDLAAAERIYEEGLALARGRGDRAAIANALYNLSFVYLAPKTGIERGRALVGESLALYEELGDRAGVAKAHWALADVEDSAGAFDEGRRHLAISLPIFRALNDRFSLGWALHSAGLLEIRAREYDAARGALGEGLRLFADARDVTGIAFLLDDFVQLAVAEGDIERAARLAGAASVLRATSGADLGALANEAEGRARPSDLEHYRTALAAAWEGGRTMPIDEVVAFAVGDRS